MIEHFQDGDDWASGSLAERNRLEGLVEYEIKVWESSGNLEVVAALKNVLKYIQESMPLWWEPDKIRDYFGSLNEPEGMTWEKRRELLATIYHGSLTDTYQKWGLVESPQRSE